MRFEKEILYAGFTVSIVKEDNRAPYELHFNALTNHRPYLAQALQNTKWSVHTASFQQNKPVWTQPLVGPSMSSMTNQLYSYLEALYTEHRKIELEELRKQRELLGIHEPEGD